MSSCWQGSSSLGCPVKRTAIIFILVDDCAGLLRFKPNFAHVVVEDVMSLIIYNPVLKLGTVHKKSVHNAADTWLLVGLELQRFELEWKSVNWKFILVKNNVPVLHNFREFLWGKIRWRKTHWAKTFQAVLHWSNAAWIRVFLRSR